ncbi:hypothetical protein CONPUDRAFT_154848 [Coniophora puteana RWD-64-598 SS2]|uniref:Uncharacterized protein n=1 Tax=Coniophora puteana (strain RWD-64-598) TaxID=741705 RepID=A0A5M3MQR9_CONPW|nr:uncharacterized protein CONPUDRAFT_154848 [Coniophora puteana RWD-64-598 SS2]EIW80861.1 hypothetical protein CONPUDRAFT_154848 [Coniophora puteana RWD-64-598 SS2]
MSEEMGHNEAFTRVFHGLLDALGGDSVPKVPAASGGLAFSGRAIPGWEHFARFMHAMH